MRLLTYVIKRKNIRRGGRLNVRENVLKSVGRDKSEPLLLYFTVFQVLISSDVKNHDSLFILVPWTNVLLDCNVVLRDRLTASSVVWGRGGSHDVNVNAVGFFTDAIKTIVFIFLATLLCERTFRAGRLIGRTMMVILLSLSL